VLAKCGRKSRRELFLVEIAQIVPWAELLPLVEPHYAKEGNGLHPVGLLNLLRTYFLQQLFNLSEPGVEKGHVHSVAKSAANVSDVHMLPDLLHGRPQRMGKRRLSGPDRSHQTGRSARPGHDLQADQVQELCGRRGQAEEHDQAQGAGQGGACLRILKRVFRPRQDKIQRHRNNHHRLCANFALVNLCLHRKRLAVLTQ